TASYTRNGSSTTGNRSTKFSSSKHAYYRKLAARKKWQAGTLRAKYRGFSIIENVSHIYAVAHNPYVAGDEKHVFATAGSKYVIVWECYNTPDNNSFKAVVCYAY